MWVKFSAVIGVVLILISVTLLAGFPTVRKLAFAGELAHDFGTVEIAPGRLGDRTHAFALRNVSGQALRIDRITTTCGCAGAESTKKVLAAGESFEISTKLVLDSTGTRLETVTVHFADHEPLKLSIRAAGRLLQDLSSMPTVVALSGDDATTLDLFYADYSSDEAPPVPAASTPAGIEVAVGNWARLLHLDRNEDQPARWHATLTVTGAAPKVRGFSPLKITMLNGAETVVRIAPAVASAN